MEKIFDQKSVKYFVWQPLGSSVNILKNFSFNSTGVNRIVSLIFTAGVFDTGLVHLDLRISPRMFEKILNDPQGLGGKKSLDIILLKS
jgi:hypothetical protein